MSVTYGDKISVRAAVVNGLSFLPGVTRLLEKSVEVEEADI